MNKSCCFKNQSNVNSVSPCLIHLYLDSVHCMVLTTSPMFIKTDPGFARKLQIFYGLNFENVDNH